MWHMCMQAHTTVNTTGCANGQPPVKLSESAIHRLVNPITWQTFTEQERRRGREKQNQAQ